MSQKKALEDELHELEVKLGRAERLVSLAWRRQACCHRRAAVQGHGR
jgi:hypothetical protein